MRVILSPQATDDIKKFDKSIKTRFKKHFEKLMGMPPRRHLRYGLPFVEGVAKQARFTYNVDGDILIILRCFATHKEYEKYYKSFR